MTFSVLGQNENYPTKKVKGIDCYVYTVQPSEGLLAIGRKFEISADEISKLNPETEKGLKAGQEILIPIKKKSDKKIKAVTNTSKQFIQHKVENKQTLFAISRKYNVSEEDIRKNNPEIANGLKVGTILQIPVPSKEIKKTNVDKPSSTISKSSQSARSNENQQFVIHIVKQDETLFSIAKRYKVDITDIVKSNPGSETKISVGSELKIPSPRAIAKAKEPKKESSIIEHKSAVAAIQVPVKENQTKYDKVIKIAFLLPFMLDQAKKDSKYDRFLNFYAGALLAIERAKENGASFEIYTYDTENSEDKVTEALSNVELKTVDLIIGPAFTSQVSLVSNFAKENKINTLIPFTGKVADIDTNPYLFQFNPGSDTELDYFVEQLSGKYKNTHVVFANVQGVNSSDDGNNWTENLKKELNNRHRSFSEIQLSTSDNSDIQTKLKKGEKNLVIFNTDKYASVSQYISLIHSTDYDITLFEQYGWRNQSDKMPKCMYISPFISNLNSSLIDEFDKQSDQYYGKDTTNDSPRYDVLGYDLSNYFIALIQKYGSNKLGTKISVPNSFVGVQSQPLFERNSANSGFINQRVYLGEDKAQ